MKLKKIFLIDDDDTVNFISKRLIQRFEITDEIVAKNSVLEALDVLKVDAKNGSLPELIFVDINMPVMDGWDFIEEFSAIGSEVADTKIILLTSLINQSDKERADGIPIISAFKEKPVTIEMLNEIQRDILLLVDP
ncbi:MAG: response regulator [Cytophagales bacterium]|nr:response regulator [Cytophagales bacterium]